MTQFDAVVVDKLDDNVTVGIQKLSLDDLPQGDVLIRVTHSSINYKDGLTSIPNGNIVKSYPFVPGIDLAGVVVTSNDSRFSPDQEVLATSYEIGVSHFGGFSQYARISADWVVPLPQGLSRKEAMAFGTAGFTAALSIHRLESAGMQKETGPILVTGATGGVGSFAVAMLAGQGYDVVASTGKENEHDFLYKLGANKVIHRKDLLPEKLRPLNKQQWAAAVDSVGGKSLAYIISSIHYGGAVAVSGLTGGIELPTTVFPFILRGVELMGIDSVYCPMDMRQHLWSRMATDLKPENMLDNLVEEISLDEVPNALSKTLNGQMRGRVVVEL